MAVYWVWLAYVVWTHRKIKLQVASSCVLFWVIFELDTSSRMKRYLIFFREPISQICKICHNWVHLHIFWPLVSEKVIQGKPVWTVDNLIYFDALVWKKILKQDKKRKTNLLNTKSQQTNTLPWIKIRGKSRVNFFSICGHPFQHEVIVTSNYTCWVFLRVFSSWGDVNKSFKNFRKIGPIEGKKTFYSGLSVPFVKVHWELYRSRISCIL